MQPVSTVQTDAIQTGAVPSCLFDSTPLEEDKHLTRVVVQQGRKVDWCKGYFTYKQMDDVLRKHKQAHELGRGVYGYVKRVEYGPAGSLTYCAVKTAWQDEMSERFLLREMQLLARFRHENIVTMPGGVRLEDAKGYRILMVMEALKVTLSEKIQSCLLSGEIHPKWVMCGTSPQCAAGKLVVTKTPAKPYQQSTLEQRRTKIVPDTTFKGKDVTAATQCWERIVKPCLSINPARRPESVVVVEKLAEEIASQSELIKYH